MGQQAAGNAVQSLFETIRSMGTPLTKDHVQHLCDAIDRIPLEDLGIDPELAAAYTVRSDGAAAAGARSKRARAEQRAASGSDAITYLHIHEDDLVTIGIFQLPEGARIPLHNHPGMTVFSRLLFGSLHIRAYDWAEPGDSGAGNGGGSSAAGSGSDDPHAMGAEEEEHQHQPHHRQHKPQPRSKRRAGKCGGKQQQQHHHHHHHHHQQQHHHHHEGEGSDNSSTSSGASCNSTVGGVRAARLVADRVLSAPTPTSVLFPSDGGNIHSFTALSPCAVLDVLTPPYAPACGRDCTYYREVFPPALVDDAGRPSAVLADQVGPWVRWQPTGGDDGSPQQQQQGPGGGGAAAVGQHPWVGGPPGGAMVVGLEAVPMPGDFLVDRGVYHGKGVTRE